MALILSALTVISVTVILFRYYAKYKLNYWKRKGVESLPTHLIFGNFKDALFFKTAPGKHLGQLYKEARQDAPFVGFYIFHKPCILLRDPELIKHVLVKNFENFSNRHFAGSQQRDSIGMRNLFGLQNPAWKYVRSKISPNLTKLKLKMMLPFMTEIAESMSQFLNDHKTDKEGHKKVDVQELSYTYAADLITSVALGTKVDSFNENNVQFSKAFHNFFHGFRRMVALVTVFFIPEIVQIFGSRVLFDNNFIKKMFWQAVESREKTRTKRGDFIDSLIQLKNGKQDPVFKFEGDNLFHQAGTFFSGFESSSTATHFTLMELANHPECQEKAREDINAAIEKHGLTYEAFSDMKYLDQCVLEGVRLHPPVSTIDRKAKEDYTIPGTDVVIEKGTAIYISLYGIHEDSRFFDRPLVFDPDRYANNEKIPDAYFPFGVGPRMCVGMKAGQLHSKVVIAMILRNYDIRQLSADRSYLDTRSTFTAAGNGIHLQFTKLT